MKISTIIDLLTKIGFLVASPLSLHAQTLDKLDSCSDISNLIYETSQDHQPCVEPTSRLSNTIKNRVSAVSICFFFPTQKVLSQFECAQVVGRSEITCYRSSDVSIVQALKANYDHGHSGETSLYLQRAATCDYGNGISSFSSQYMIGNLLLWVARADLNFGVEIGPRDSPKGIVTHGFAKVDPSISGAPHEIEFVNAETNNCRTGCASSQNDHEEELDHQGNLVLLKDKSAKELEDSLNNQAHDARAPIRYEVEFYKIEPEMLSVQHNSVDDLVKFRTAPLRTPDINRPVSIILKRANNLIKAEGYNEVSWNQMEAMGFSQDLFRRSLSSIPHAYAFDVQDLTGIRQFKFNFYFQDKDLDCIRTRFDGLGVGIFSSGEHIGLFSIGAGHCKFSTSDPLTAIQPAITLDNIN